jgi:hypothetical protein
MRFWEHEDVVAVVSTIEHWVLDARQQPIPTRSGSAPVRRE